MSPQYLTIECVRDKVEEYTQKRFLEKYGNETSLSNFCKLIELPKGGLDKFLLSREFMENFCKI
ncbi:MAG TPA: hypothetical protein H9908_07395, partial [Candidatus Rothia avistercoris]|nr:hypothetical protein [Candidatus Rothia avistercoris]